MANAPLPVPAERLRLRVKIGDCEFEGEGQIVFVNETLSSWNTIRRERDYYALRHGALERQIENMLRVLYDTGRATPKQVEQWKRELEASR